jgi:hypothetical protein
VRGPGSHFASAPSRLSLYYDNHPIMIIRISTISHVNEGHSPNIEDPVVFKVRLVCDNQSQDDFNIESLERRFPEMSMFRYISCRNLTISSRLCWSRANVEEGRAQKKI